MAGVTVFAHFYTDDIFQHFVYTVGTLNYRTTDSSKTEPK